MALPFKNPDPNFRFTVGDEKRAIGNWFRKRGVPASRAGSLLLASWNIANLGAQGRRPGALRLIAHILKRFDLISVQEVNDDFTNFLAILDAMGSGFDYVMTDTAGNDERLAFVYRKAKVEPTNLFGELALRPREYPKRTVRVRWKDKNKKARVQVFKNLRFVPFDRNPFIGSFRCGQVDFILANVHLYFGKFQDSKKPEERKKYARRVLEIFALSKWAHSLFRTRVAYDRDIILLGDMNVPSMEPDESTYKALVRFGWQPLEPYEVTRTAGTNLGNDKTYDQMVFAPEALEGRILRQGVFDFDNAIFRRLWNKLEREMAAGERTRRSAVGWFNRHVKHHVSDHRPLWVEIDAG